VAALPGLVLAAQEVLEILQAQVQVKEILVGIALPQAHIHLEAEEEQPLRVLQVLVLLVAMAALELRPLFLAHQLLMVAVAVAVDICQMDIT
jgi:hypothetical protein